MVFLYSVVILICSFILSQELKFSFILQIINIFSPLDLLVFIWILCSLILIYTNNNNTWVTTTLLYVFGIYRSFIENTAGTILLIYNNATLLLYFMKYNLIDFVNFWPKIQIWTPLFRKGGYLLLLNSSRTRWQLSQTHNFFKNK